MLFLLLLLLLLLLFTIDVFLLKLGPKTRGDVRIQWQLPFSLKPLQSCDEGEIVYSERVSLCLFFFSQTAECYTQKDGQKGEQKNLNIPSIQSSLHQ